MESAQTYRSPETELQLEGWSPARIFMLISALWHLALGVVGLVLNQAFPVGSGSAGRSASEHIFGIFETNGWHSLAALLLGFISAFFLVSPSRAREAALVIGVFHVALVAALVVWPPESFWIASNTADQIVHSATALSGIGSALLSRKRA